MPQRKPNQYAEPVPPASQLAALPFLAAVEGFLRGVTPTARLRLTLHRTLNRQGSVYLQQVCPYLGPETREQRRRTGRIFEVNFGIIGAAFGSQMVWRTKHYADFNQLRADIAKGMEKVGDTRDPAAEPSSWLAIPFLGAHGTPILVLFADCFEFNFFADDARLVALVDMCWGFCRLIDLLEEDPFPTLRNFGFESGDNVIGKDSVYPLIQESVPSLPTPRFARLMSFNFDAAVG